MHQPVKNYIYVSDTKVDELYWQIPKNRLREIATELTLDLKVDLKPVGVGIGTTFKREQAQETRYSKLRVVVEYIERQMSENIGWIDAPQAYFRGMLPMFWGFLPNRADNQAVYFGGSTGQTLLGLGGSKYHIIGKKSDATFGESSSDLASFLAVLDKEISIQPRLPYYLPDKNAALDVVEVIARQAKGPLQTLEFLAIKLAYDPSSLAHGRIRPRSKHVLFGTPIYVALAE